MHAEILKLGTGGGYALPDLPASFFGKARQALLRQWGLPGQGSASPRHAWASSASPASSASQETKQVGEAYALPDLPASFSGKARQALLRQ